MIPQHCQKLFFILCCTVFGSAEKTLQVIQNCLQQHKLLEEDKRDSFMQTIIEVDKNFLNTYANPQQTTVRLSQLTSGQKLRFLTVKQEKELRQYIQFTDDSFEEKSTNYCKYFKHSGAIYVYPIAKIEKEFSILYRLLWFCKIIYLHLNETDCRWSEDRSMVWLDFSNFGALLKSLAQEYQKPEYQQLNLTQFPDDAIIQELNEIFNDDRCGDFQLTATSADFELFQLKKFLIERGQADISLISNGRQALKQYLENVQNQLNKQNLVWQMWHEEKPPGNINLAECQKKPQYFANQPVINPFQNPSTASSKLQSTVTIDTSAKSPAIKHNNNAFNQAPPTTQNTLCWSSFLCCFKSPTID